jgi:transposase-like protein
MAERTRRRFTAEYKNEAVKRLEESGRSLQEVADALGVHANQLRGWRHEQRAAGSAEALAPPAYNPLRHQFADRELQRGEG